jgi:hypothetical protein
MQLVASEWRWLITISIILVLIAYIPLLWVATRDMGDYEFMGMLLNFQDGGSYLSKMEIGFRGGLAVTFQHTPENHNGAFIQILYPLIGQLSRLTGISPLVMFHVARLGASLFMYIALYQLSASIWSKIRARKVFFGIASLGSGFGWFLSGTIGTTDFPDLTLPEAFPFFSTLMNVHFPLTLALLALLLAVLITALRPGAELDSSSDQPLPFAALTSFLLSVLYPQTLVPLGGALFVYVLIAILQTRTLNGRHIRWLLATGIPALPMLAYYVLVVQYNPAITIWNSQNITAAAPLHIVALGLGIPLLLALPGIWRALRRFELDGDRLVLLWLIFMLIAMYLPTNIQRRFAAGMMIPVAYFATRAIEDVWLQYVSRRRRPIVFTLVFSLMPISLLLVLFAPVLLINIDPQRASGIILENDYREAFAYIRENSETTDVILAAPDVSAWIPGYAGARVVYGHQFETLNASVREASVRAWYGEAVSGNCDGLLTEEAVRYILIGPQELRLGAAACATQLQEVARFGSVTVYAP